MKLLITGGTALASLKLLKAFERHEVILADYGDVPMLNSNSYQLMSLGVKNEEIAAHHLLSTCLDAGIDTVLPLHAFEISATAKAKVLFGEFGIQVLVPQAEELAHYLNQTKAPKLTDWAVYDSGKLIYASTGNPFWQQQQNLNGAFAYADDQLFLITI